MAQAVRVAADDRAAVWILGSWKDLLLFVATPVLVLPLGMLALRGLSIEALALYVGAFGALGHHLPGLMRAYGDRELFARYRMRFVLAPIFFVSVALFFAVTSLGALAFVVVVWGIWHGLAQVYGFCRIYDAKVGASSPWNGHLDRWLLVFWFGTGLLHASDRMGSTIEKFYTAGGPILSTWGFEAFRTGWLAATGVVTAAFLANWFWQRAQGVSPNPVKMLLLVSSVAYWWYTTAGLQSAVLGVALFEIFHDVQYLAITWVYNRGSVDKGRDVGRFTRFLFRPRGAMLLLYVALVFAFGAFSLFAESTPPEPLGNLLLGLVGASTLLHFYYDSFIWNVRDRSTRAGLGVAGGQQATTPSWSPSARLGQAARWSLFLVPVIGLGAGQMAGLESPLMERYRSIAELYPDQPEAQSNLGTLLAGQGRTDEAIAHYQRALELRPDHAEFSERLGGAYLHKGSLTLAQWSFEAALRLNPDLAAAHNGLGLVYKARGDLARARQHLETALRLHPDFALAHANLADLRLASGDEAGAVAQYLRALQANPGLGPVHAKLGLLLEERGDLAGARAHLQRASQITSTPEVRAGLQRVTQELDGPL